MMPSQYILFGAGAGVLVVAFVGVVWLWRRSSRSEEKAESSSTTPPPCRISLVQQEMPVWRGEKFIAGYAEHFRSLGFQPIAAYRIPELDNQGILALVHPGQRFFACVYDSKTNPTFEIFAAFKSDNSLVGTNSVWARDIEQRPGSITVRIPNATPAQVLEALRQHEKAGDRIAVSAEQFATAFLQGYIRNYNWRLKKAEPSRDQLRMDARVNGTVLSREQLEESYGAKRAAYVQQLQDACRAQFKDEHKLDRADWERWRNRMVAVPEGYDLKEVIGTVSLITPTALNERQLFALQQLDTSLGDDGIVLINKIISRNVAELGLRQIGEVKEPVRAWIVVKDDPPAAVEDEDLIQAPDELKAAA